jgi:hypothetical protein
MVRDASLVKKAWQWCGKLKYPGGGDALSRSPSSHANESFQSEFLPALGANVSSTKLINNKYVISPYNPYYR